jgi:hypothetical protein
MLAVSGADLDLDYIAQWAPRLGVGDLWDAARRRDLGGR